MKMSGVALKKGQERNFGGGQSEYASINVGGDSFGGYPFNVFFDGGQAEYPSFDGWINAYLHGLNSHRKTLYEICTLQSRIFSRGETSIMNQSAEKHSEC